MSLFGLQVKEVQGYKEDQVVLIVLDFLNFMVQVPIILGTSTISHIMNTMKEREIDTLATPSVNAQVTHFFSVQRAAAMVEDD